MELDGQVLAHGIAGASIGALLGITLNAIDVATLASDTACTAARFCTTADPYASVGYAAVGVAAGVLVTIALCWIGFALARVRPLLITVPAGICLALLTTLVYVHVYTTSGRWNGNQPELGPGWTVTVVYGGVFMVFAAAAGLIRRLDLSRP